MVQDPEIGAWYIVAGQGPMKLEKLEDERGKTIQMRTPAGYTYWASRDMLVREVDLEFICRYIADGKARNLYHEGLEEVRAWVQARS